MGRKTLDTLQPSLSPWRQLSVALQPPLKSALLDCTLMALLPGWSRLSPLYGRGNRGTGHDSHLPRAPRAEVAASAGICAWPQATAASARPGRGVVGRGEALHQASNQQNLLPPKPTGLSKTGGNFKTPKDPKQPKKHSKVPVTAQLDTRAQHCS